MLGLKRYMWQNDGLFSCFRGKDNYKCRIVASCSLKKRGLDILDEQIQLEILGMKTFLSEAFGVSVTLGGLNFYSIAGDRLVFRKRKNTNLNFELNFHIGIRTFNDFNRILAKLLYWKEMSELVRRTFDLHVGFFVSKTKRNVRLNVTLVNPNFLNEFFKETLYGQDSKLDLSKNVLLKIAFLCPKSYIEKLNSLFLK